jgi:hypothetical protein
MSGAIAAWEVVVALGTLASIWESSIILKLQTNIFEIMPGRIPHRVQKFENMSCGISDCNGTQFIFDTCHLYLTDVIYI